jgi:glycosyltransferase involved in cell wall biosynthesis
MNLAVVIPSFETPPKILRRCLESILNQVGAESLEIIVVESSLSELPEDLLEFQDRVRFFLPNRRMLAGEARNFGASQTDKEFLAFFSPPSGAKRVKDGARPQWRGLKSRATQFQ